jgi:predicted ATPase
MPALDRITLKGFKSIKELIDFELKPINILVGANGAGKSNLVDFFRMLRAMAEGGFQKFVALGGGGDGFLFNGPKETPEIQARLRFGGNDYRFALSPTPDGSLLFTDESTDWIDLKERRSRSGGGKEANLRLDGYVYETISSWTVYHFHDTSTLAPMRRPCSVRDFRELRPDAGNISAFLLRMRDEHPPHYARIRDSIRLVAPFFDDFMLDPEQRGEDQVLRLEWRQQGSAFPFQPWHLSDGTLRFICLATALLQPSLPSTIVIDEPELGQHPVALEALAALMHEAALRTQIVICTQSPLLLDHFDPEHLVIVERRDGASVFRRLETGPLEQWLDEYSLGELTRRDIVETGPRYD